MLYRGSLTDLKRRVEGTVGPSAEPGDG